MFFSRLKKFPSIPVFPRILSIMNECWILPRSLQGSIGSCDALLACYIWCMLIVLFRTGFDSLGQAPNPGYGLQFFNVAGFHLPTFFFIGLHVRIHTGVWFLLFKNNLSSSFFFHLSCWGRREHICFIPLAADRQPAVFLVWDTLEMEPRASHMLSTCCIVKLYSPHPLPNEHLKASLWLPFHKRRYPVKQALKKWKVWIRRLAHLDHPDLPT